MTYCDEKTAADTLALVRRTCPLESYTEAAISLFMKVSDQLASAYAPAHDWKHAAGFTLAATEIKDKSYEPFIVLLSADDIAEVLATAINKKGEDFPDGDSPDGYSPDAGFMRMLLVSGFARVFDIPVRDYWDRVYAIQ